MTESEAIGYSEKCIMSCDDDLEFINNMKMENSLSGISKVCSSKDLLIHKGRRRNSSFAEFFEGDLSQNLLSRKDFASRDCESFSDTVSSMFNHIRGENSEDMGLNMKIGHDDRLENRKLSQVSNQKGNYTSDKCNNGQQWTTATC